MSKDFYSILLSLFLLTVLTPSQAIAGRCSGDKYCTACKNCSACKHCSQEGGSCGVCASYEEQDLEPEYVPIPVNQEPIVESEPDNSHDLDYSDGDPSVLNDPKEDSKSNFGWVWWVVSIGVAIWFLGSLGKK